MFLDLILKREGYQESTLILNAIEKTVFDGVVLDITILNIDYVAKKQVKEIKDFLVLINSLFEVVGASNKTIKEALAMPNNDLEDNLQYVCAKHSKSEIIISNDKNFIKTDIQTLSSREFVERYLD
ncbi:MAG TPA: PIN domain-containing protein [Campylobacterales bacterium]|nr:PIN domain-containing protein [Campylobacterales bacterium]